MNAMSRAKRCQPTNFIKTNHIDIKVIKYSVAS